MGNMSYCMFENTEGDLSDCVDRMQDGIDLEDMSDTEKRAMRDMNELCRQFMESYAEDYEEEIEKEE